MNITEFTFRILIIFFPGIIAYFITNALTIHRKGETYHFLIIRSFVLGLLSYVILYFLNLLYGIIVSYFGVDHEFAIQIFTVSLGGKPSVSYTEIIWATILAIPMSFVLALAENKKWLNRVAKRMKVTQKMGDIDLWNFVLESPETEWIVVRDIKYNLAYQGRIQGFSGTFNENELFLRDVLVLQNDTGENLYEVDALYLSRDPKDLTIEFKLEVEDKE